MPNGASRDVRPHPRNEACAGALSERFELRFETRVDTREIFVLLARPRPRGAQQLPRGGAVACVEGDFHAEVERIGIARHELRGGRRRRCGPMLTAGMA